MPSAITVWPQLADYDAPALFIGTPRSYNHLYDLFVRGQEGGSTWASWQFRTRDNPFIDPAEIESARRDTDERTFRQEWEASFEALSGRAYYGFLRSDHVRQVELDRALPVLVSADFNLDPSSAVIAQRCGDELACGARCRRGTRAARPPTPRPSVPGRCWPRWAGVAGCGSTAMPRAELGRRQARPTMPCCARRSLVLTG